MKFGGPGRQLRAKWSEESPNVRDTAYYVLSLASVQGGTFVTQLLVAALLSPADFGIVRTIEAFLGPMLVAGALGMPSVAIAYASRATTEVSRAELTRRLLRISVGVSLVVAAIAAVVFAIVVQGPLRPFLLLSVWLILLSAPARTAINLSIGSGRVRSISIATACASVVAILLVVAAVAGWGLWGWLVSRYLAEVIVLSLALFLLPAFLRASRDPASEFTARLLMTVGATLSLSLLTRSVVDNMGLFVMSRSFGADPVVGQYGLATVGITALMLVPGAFGNLLVPRMAALRSTPDVARKALMSGLALTCVVTLVPCAIFTLAREPLLSLAFPSYAAGADVIALMLWAAPMRAITSLFGGALVAFDRSSRGLAFNLVCLVIGMILQLELTRRYGVFGSAWALLLTDALGAVLYGVGASRALRTGDLGVTISQPPVA